MVIAFPAFLAPRGPFAPSAVSGVVSPIGIFFPKPYRIFSPSSRERESCLSSSRDRTNRIDPIRFDRGYNEGRVKINYGTLQNLLELYEEC